MGEERQIPEHRWRSPQGAGTPGDRAWEYPPVKPKHTECVPKESYSS